MYFFLSILAYFVLFLAVLIGFVYLYFLYSFGYWKRRGVDYLQPTFPLGNIGPMLRCVTSMSVSIADLYNLSKGPYTGIYLMNKPALIIKDPELLKHVLVKDFSVFHDRGMYCDEKLEPLSGHLFRLNGPRWRYMRSKLSSSFSIGKLKMMFETMVQTAKQFEAQLDTVSEKGDSTNIKDHSLRYSADVIASVIFGIEVNSFRDPNNRWWKFVRTLLVTNYLRTLVFMLVLFFPEILKALRLTSIFKKSNLQIFELVKEVVDYREKNKLTRNDFMQLLIQLKNSGEVNVDDNVRNTNVFNKNKTADRLSIYEISAQAYSMFFAGFDTSATTISWTLYELANHPKIQQAVHEELDRCLAKYGGELTYEALAEMTYLDCVISETLRKYPVLGAITRIPNRDYVIPDTTHVITKGTIVFMSILGLQNDPAFFTDPDTFNPDRFLPENKSKIQSYTYMPFGEGPRNCIGKRFGQLQAAVGLVMVLRNHSVGPNKTQEKIVIDSNIFSHVPVNPITLIVRKRNIMI